MFFSINKPNLSVVHEDLRAFVLNKERRGLPEDQYGLYLYVLKGSISRYIGTAGILTGNGIRVISELSAPPFGLVLELEPKDKQGFCDITFFGNQFYYNEKATIKLNVPILDSHSYFPCDYRTRRQILEDRIKNKLAEMYHGNLE